MRPSCFLSISANRLDISEQANPRPLCPTLHISLRASSMTGSATTTEEVDPIPDSPGTQKTDLTRSVLPLAPWAPGNQGKGPASQLPQRTIPIHLLYTRYQGQTRVRIVFSRSKSGRTRIAEPRGHQPLSARPKDLPPMPSLSCWSVQRPLSTRRLPRSYHSVTLRHHRFLSHLSHPGFPKFLGPHHACPPGLWPIYR